jgi:hypothetical protein
MAGRIKSGEGTLIGNAGEFYVAAELLKRGVIAAMAPRNAPAFDIIAAKEKKTVRIRVKTKSEEYENWQWVVKKDGTIFRYLSESNDFTILVNLTKETKDLAFFVVPTPMINNWLISDFNKWVETPGKNGRPHDKTNTKRHLRMSQERLAPYLYNWEILWK